MLSVPQGKILIVVMYLHKALVIQNHTKGKF